MHKIITFLIICLFVLSCNTSKKETTPENITVTETKSIPTKEFLTLNNEETAITNNIEGFNNYEKKLESIDEVNENSIETEKETIIEKSNITTKTKNIIDISSNSKASTSSSTENNKKEILEKISNTTNKTEDSPEIKTENNITSKITNEKPKLIINESERIFIKKRYKITGNWSLKQEGNNVYIVFHSNFKTKNGPDLKVFLSKQTMNQVNGKNAEDSALFLNDLKSNEGEQRYLIPSHITLSQYKSILIHCKKYSKLWGGGNL